MIYMSVCVCVYYSDKLECLETHLMHIFRRWSTVCLCPDIQVIMLTTYAHIQPC